MYTRIDSYILRQLLVSLGAVTIGLAALVWLTQSLRFIELVLDRGLSFWVFLELTGLLLPSFFSVILPITTFDGLALLGLREGESLRFDRPEGRQDWIVLEKVLYQPGAATEEPPVAWPSFRLIAGGLADRTFCPANENGPGSGPGPSAA